ncbi:MAG: tetratricopeptide repeat protein [Thiotrichales bacterium]
MRRRLYLALACMSLGVSVALADALSELPATRAGELVVVNETDLSGLEVGVRQVIVATRAEVARLLQDPGTSRAGLGEAYGRLASLYHVYEIPTAARTAYTNAIALQPDVFRWRYYLANLDLAGGRAVEALQMLNQAHRLQPTYGPLDLRFGQALFDSGDLKAARKRFEIAFHRVGQRAMAAYYLGQIALLEKDPRAAVLHFEEALTAYPDANRVFYPLAQALRAIGEDAKAREYLARQGPKLPGFSDPMMEELEALKQGGRVQFERAMRAFERGDLNGAINFFVAGLEQEPDNQNARISLARLRFVAGDPVEAEALLQQTLAANPGHALAQFLLGLLLEHKDEGMLAEQHYRAAIRFDPTHVGAHAHLAGRLFIAGHYKTAAEHFSAAARADRDLATLPIFRLVALSRAGAKSRVLRDELEQLLRERPREPLWRYALIRLLSAASAKNVRDPKRALELAQALYAEHPVPPHQEALALAHAANGDFTQAEILLRQVQLAALWLPGPQQQRIAAALERVAAKVVPKPAWPPHDALLEPPSFDAFRSFRDYPSATPF